MRKIILFLCLCSYGSFSQSTELQEFIPACAMGSKSISLEKSPFLVSEIKVSGPHVHIVNPQGPHLYFNCAFGMAQFKNPDETIKVSSTKPNAETHQLERNDWLILQERDTSSPPQPLTFITRLMASMATRKNYVGLKPILITNKNENPVRTQVALNYIEKTVEIQDPADPSRKLKIICEREGTVSLQATNGKRVTNFKLMSPSKVDQRSPQEPATAYECYDKVRYNYETGSLTSTPELHKPLQMTLPSLEAYEKMPLPIIPAPAPSPVGEGGGSKGKALGGVR